METLISRQWLHALHRRRREGTPWSPPREDPGLRPCLQRHGIAAWLLPRDDSERIRLQDLQAARAMVFEEELDRILAPSPRKGILVLKGTVLDGELYEDRGIRGYDDLDLLVDPTVRESFVGELLRGGYERQTGGPVEEKWARRHESGLWISVDGRLAMKCPNRAHRAYEAPTDELLARMRISRGATGSWPTLGLEDGLLYLALHAAEHGFERLIWLLDLSLYVEKHASEIDWPFAETLARRWKLRRVCATCAQLCETLFGRRWPRQARLAFGPPRLARRIAPWARAFLLDVEGPRWTRGHRLLLRMLLVDHLSDLPSWGLRHLLRRREPRP